MFNYLVARESELQSITTSAVTVFCVRTINLRNGINNREILKLWNTTFTIEIDVPPLDYLLVSNPVLC